MHYKLLLTSFGIMAFLCLISPNLLAQSQPESSENVLVLQKGNKEKIAETGDYVFLKTENGRRPYSGRIKAINDSTIVVRGREFRVSALERIVLSRRVWRRIGAWLILTALLTPFLFGFLFRMFTDWFGPPYSTNRAWRWLITVVNNTYTSLILGGIFVLFKSFRRYKMKKWKVKVRRREF